MYVCVCHMNKLESGVAIPPVGQSGKGIYKHSTVESWASDISRLGIWDWDRPHRVYASYTPMAQVCYIIVLIDTDRERMLLCSAPACI